MRRMRRLRAPILATFVVAAIAVAQLGSVSFAGTAEESAAPMISVSFGREEIWDPGQADAIHDLHQCPNHTFSCIRDVMLANGASEDAIAFYRLTGWFLADIEGTGGAIQIGQIVNPWRANENNQLALLGGIPPVVYPETEAVHMSIVRDPLYPELSAAYPELAFWAPGPRLESIDPLPDGGQRITMGYRVLNGCHACQIIAWAHVAFDFEVDGTYDGAHFLNLTEAEGQ